MTCTPTTCRPATRSPVTVSSTSASSITTRTWRRAWPSTDVGESDAVGAIFDGTGYGTDGTVWGGELLVGGLAGFERVGTLWPVRMPGAAQAIRQPWRMAFAWLAAAFGEPRPPSPPLAPAGRASALGRDGADRSQPGGVADDVEHREAVRRGRGAVRDRERGQLRGPGGGRARGGSLGGGPVRELRDRGGRRLGARSASRDPGDLGRSRPWGRSRGRSVALSRRDRERDDRGGHGDRVRARGRTPPYSAAACSRTGCCSRTSLRGCTAPVCGS